MCGRTGCPADRGTELAAAEARRRHRGRAARAAAEGYSWDAHFARMLALYEEVAAKKKTKNARSAHRAHRASSSAP
jgi:hypothetical protein